LLQGEIISTLETRHEETIVFALGGNDQFTYNSLSLHGQAASLAGRRPGCARRSRRRARKGNSRASLAEGARTRRRGRPLAALATQIGSVALANAGRAAVALAGVSCDACSLKATAPTRWNRPADARSHRRPPRLPPARSRPPHAL
jgi:hypothetical protein